MGATLKLIYALIFGVCALALVGGCGSEEGATTIRTDRANTKVDFQQQADAICAKAERRRDAAVVESAKGEELIFGGDNAAVEDLIVEAVLPVVRAMVGELAELKAPDAKAAAIVSAYEATIEGTDANPRRFVVRGGIDPLAQARILAATYGLKVCGKL